MESKSIEANYVDWFEVHSSNENVTAYVGDSQKFSCNASNTIFRRWQYKNDSSHPVALSRTSNCRISITPNFELLLTNITVHDKEIYQCYLSSHVEVIYLVHYLSVQGKCRLGTRTQCLT